MLHKGQGVLGVSHDGCMVVFSVLVSKRRDGDADTDSDRRYAPDLRSAT